MCELCTGEFEQIATIEVGQAAWAVQHTDAFGPFNAVIEDCNVEDEHILSAMAEVGKDSWEYRFGEIFLALTEAERISALAMAANLWGVEPIPYRGLDG